MKTKLENALHASCKLVMGPVAKFFISSGLQYSDFLDIARGEFVRAACDLTNTSESTASMATRFGISRRELARYRDEEEINISKLAYELSLPAVVLSRWFQDRDYVNDAGEPRRINKIEFEELVSRSGLNDSLEEILQELVSSNTIQKQAEGTYLPIKRYFIPVGGDPRQILRFGIRLSDLANTLHSNAISDNPRIEASAYNSHVKISQLPMLRKITRTQGKSLLQSIDDWLSAHSDPSSDDVVRAGIGLYFFEDDSEIR